jgi:hypothetical protein
MRVKERVSGRRESVVSDAIIDKLLASADAKNAIDPNRVIDDLKKALAKRVRTPLADRLGP